MSYWKKILIVIALGGLVFCGFKVYDVLKVFSSSNTAFNTEEAHIYIPSSKDKQEIKSKLTLLVKDMNSFSIVASKLGYISNIKPGKFTVKKGMNNVEIVRTLLGNGEDVTVKIPKKKTIGDVAKIVANQIEATEAELYKVMEQSMNFKNIKVHNAPFNKIGKPGTYKIPWNTSAEEFRSIVLKDQIKSVVNE